MHAYGTYAHKYTNTCTHMYVHHTYMHTSIHTYHSRKCRIWFYATTHKLFACAFRSDTNPHKLARPLQTLRHNTTSQVRSRSRCLSFHPVAQCVHVLKGLVCHARITPASSPALHCKQCSALASPSLPTQVCASPSRVR